MLSSRRFRKLEIPPKRIAPVMLTIGTCRLCSAGSLGLRRCGVCRRVVVLCDECDAAWPTGDVTPRPTYSIEGETPCPGCHASLFGGGSHWATREEIRSAAWTDQLAIVPSQETKPVSGDELAGA